MSLKPIYELNTTTMIDENHTILVYQDNRLKKLNAKDIFYTNDQINKNVVIPKNDIIQALANLHVNAPSDATLYDLINYVDKIDLFEIGVRRLIHDGTDTSVFSGEPSAINNPKFVGMGNPQTSPILERCYKIGGLLTVIPRINTPNPQNDLIYASMSTNTTRARNDFYGGEYASDKWASGIYPWNAMEKIIDEDGNHFTKVPLYFIKDEYVTDTGIDISASYPIIPKKYINNIIYQYTFVCKTKLPGYRPAEFFYDYKKHDMIEDSEGEYVYVQDLDCYTIPLYYDNTNKRYKLNIDQESNNYTKILTRDHYFSCYETSLETINDKICIVSKPNKEIEHLSTISRYRTYCKNANKLYNILDLRSLSDFFCTLFSIEFATTNCQSIANGVTSGAIYSDSIVTQNDITNSNTIKVNTDFSVGRYITIGTTLGIASPIAGSRKVLSSVLNSDGTYNITFDGEPVTAAAGSCVWSTYYRTGECDHIEFRSAYNSTSKNNYMPFKWNWIENIYGNESKIIDGINIKSEADENGLIENCIYVSNNPNLYNDTATNYSKIRYILPSEFLNSSGVRTSSNGIVTQLGYDSLYPWCKLPSKCSSINSTSEGYTDRLSQNSHNQTSNIISTPVFGGNWTNGSYAGLYSFTPISSINNRSGLAIFFEKPGK